MSQEVRQNRCTATGGNVRCSVAMHTFPTCTATKLFPQPSSATPTRPISLLNHNNMTIMISDMKPTVHARQTTIAIGCTASPLCHHTTALNTWKKSRRKKYITMYRCVHLFPSYQRAKFTASKRDNILLASTSRNLRRMTNVALPKRCSGTEQTWHLVGCASVGFPTNLSLVVQHICY